MTTAALPILTDEEAESAPHVMHVMDNTGDTIYGWDPDKPVEVELAQKQFQTMRDKGYAAYRADKKGDSTGEIVRTFDPKAGRLVFIAPMQGG